MKINKENMFRGASGGFTNATDAADYLVKKGLPFREAHEFIGKLVLYAIKNNKSLADLSLAEYKLISPIFEEDIYHAISMETCVESRNVIGAPSEKAVLAAIANTEKSVSEICII